MVKLDELRPLRIGAARAGTPAVTVTRRAVDRLREGSVWVYRSDVEQVLPAAHSATGLAEVAPGAVVTVLDSRGAALGSALFSDASQIALRLVSDLPGLDRAGYLDDLAARLAAALTLREELAPTSPDNDACRLIFAEADRLPGIVVDQYGELAIVQLLTQGTAQADVREVLARELSARLPLSTIVERPDPRIRQVEALGESPSAPLFSRVPEPNLKPLFTINGLKFGYDATAGQKTGAFLDQRLNYQAAARRATGRALDICTYQGGFALHLARRCARVTGVDASRAALEVADANLERNAASLTAKVDWMEADAFDLLREYESAGERYDTIVLDPPAFAKSKRALEGAMRGYKEMNLRALKMLASGGTLVTCSCSQHVSLAEFQAMLASAAADAKRRVQVLEVRGAAPDHPAIVTLGETNYLKCLICRVE
jgi:23S rRNA (cytosine1962-C5)-methyltransferase